MAAAVKTVHFEDHGQDFLEWDVDTQNKVVACRPYQSSVWVGKRLVAAPKKGGKCAYMHDGELHTIKYTVTKVVAL
jgi:hypothetical protein